MMSSRMLPGSFFIAVLFFISCGGNEENTETEKKGNDTVLTAPATNEPVAPPSTIITTPQAMILIRHNVADYSKWKSNYDAHDSVRLANGVHSYVIGRGVGDSNTVFVAVKGDDMAKAKAFAASPSLKAAIQKGGVKGKTSISVVNITFQDTAVLNNSNIRSLVSLAVKDWDVWQKSFVEGAQERIDNGIATRAYGHDADDNKKVTLVTAILDTSKAQAYWKSDMLKKRREAGGVIGTPDRFVFKVVQRYR